MSIEGPGNRPKGVSGSETPAIRPGNVRKTGHELGIPPTRESNVVSTKPTRQGRVSTGFGLNSEPITMSSSKGGDSGDGSDNNKKGTLDTPTSPPENTIVEGGTGSKTINRPTGTKGELPPIVTRDENAQTVPEPPQRHLRAVRSTTMTPVAPEDRERVFGRVHAVPVGVTRPKTKEFVPLEAPKIDPEAKVEQIMDSKKAAIEGILPEHQVSELLLIADMRKEFKMPFDPQIREKVDEAYAEMGKREDAPVKRLSVNQSLDMAKLLTGTDFDEEARLLLQEAKDKITNDTFSHNPQADLETKSTMLSRVASQFTKRGDLVESMQIADDILAMTKAEEADALTKEHIWGTWATVAGAVLARERDLGLYTKSGEISPTLEKVFVEMEGMPDAMSAFNPRFARDKFVMDVTSGLLQAERYQDAEICIGQLVSDEKKFRKYYQLARIYSANGDTISAKRIDKLHTSLLDKKFARDPESAAYEVASYKLAKIEGLIDAGRVEPALTELSTLPGERNKISGLLDIYRRDDLATAEIKERIYEQATSLPPQSRVELYLDMAKILGKTDHSVEEKAKLNEQITTFARDLQIDRIGGSDTSEVAILAAFAQTFIVPNDTFSIYKDLEPKIKLHEISELASFALFQTQLKAGDAIQAKKTFTYMEINGWVHRQALQKLPEDSSFMQKARNGILAKQGDLDPIQFAELFELLAERQIELGMDASQALADLEVAISLQENERLGVTMGSLAELYVESYKGSNH